jgi:sigma-54 specific flagellar transcriptional regulator A
MNVVDKLTSPSEQNKSTLDKLNKMIDGDSPDTKSMKNLIAMVSQTDSTALILGETGTGKDIVAQAIHKCSNKKGPFITVNCAAIPSELLESELFGHEKGSFTGADKQRKGRFEQSSGGSLFLDEIGDMPLPLQAKLLRAIESKTIQRVGGAEDIKIDLRLICATHRDLEKKVESGEFRADLFFRINVLPINVPSLAERRTDIPSLQKTLLTNLNVEETMKPIFTPDAITALCKHNWPGNVRELKNVIERACIIFPGKEITGTNVYENLLRLKVPTTAEEQDALWEMTSDLSGITNIEENDLTNNLEDYLPHPKNYKNWFSFYDEIDLRRHLQDVEIVLIEEALEKTNNKVALAADKLKLRRTTLIEKMKKFSINTPKAPID